MQIPALTIPAFEVRERAGEPLRYEVRGRSLRCDCGYIWSPKQKTKRKEGDQCPKCNRGELVHIWHLVDLTSYRGNGKCGCEWFEFQMQGKLEKGEAPSEALKCDHILALIYFWGNKKIEEISVMLEKKQGKQNE